MRQIFDSIIAEHSFTQPPEVLCIGAPTWVIKTGVSHQPEDQVAIRLRHATDPEKCLHEVRRQVALMQKLRRLGARVVEFLGDPWIESGEGDSHDWYVASMARFLPGKGTDRQHGAGLATVHDASELCDLTSYQRMDPLVSITDVIGALRHVQERQAKGQPFMISGVRISPDDIENMERTYHQANDLRQQLFNKAQDNGSALVVVQEDVHANNRGLSHDGVGTIMDIDPYIGPASMDFGRMENDMARFTEPYNYTSRDEYCAGYQETIASGQLPPADERALAGQFSHRRTPLIMTALAINTVRAGYRGDAWQLKEGLYRLETIDKDVLWHSDDNDRRLKDRAAQQ